MMEREKDIDRLEHLFKSKQCGIVLRTKEEERTIQNVAVAAECVEPVDLVCWSAPSGMREIGFRTTEHGKVLEYKQASEDRDIKQVFANVAEWRKNHDGRQCILLLLDAQCAFDKPNLRYCREALDACRKGEGSIVFVGCHYQIPPEIDADMWVMDMRIACEQEIEGYLKSTKAQYKSAGKDVMGDDEICRRFARAVCGLTMSEIMSITSLCLAEHGDLTKESIRLAISEKSQLVKRGGLFEIETPKHGMEKVGGLKLLKEWAKKLVTAFEPDAKADGIDYPRGALFIGPMGTGKTLSVRALADIMDSMIMRVDWGRMFGQYVGESEKNVESLIRTVEGLGRCILMLDEIDKTMNRNAGGGDSGTSDRCFARFLSWMQDTESPVFVAATANYIENIDAALLRRFDETFYVDIPNESAKKEIFTIHLGDKWGGIKKTDIPELARRAKHFVGSEIKKAIQHARREARYMGRKMSKMILMDQIKGIVPVAVTMAAQVEHMRELVRDGRVRLADEIEAKGKENWMASNYVMPDFKKGESK